MRKKEEMKGDIKMSKMKECMKNQFNVVMMVGLTVLAVIGGYYGLVRPQAAEPTPQTTGLSSEAEMLAICESDLNFVQLREADYGLLEEHETYDLWKEVSTDEAYAFEVVQVYHGGGEIVRKYPNWTEEEYQEQLAQAKQRYEEALADYEASLSHDITE